MKDENSIIPRSVHYQSEKKKLACWALFVFFVTEFIILSVFDRFPLNLHQVTTSGLKLVMSYKGASDTSQINKKFDTVKSIYNLSNSRSDVYIINGDIRINSDSSTIFVDSEDKSSWTLCPYPRKIDNFKKVGTSREWKIQASPNLKQFPVCKKQFNVPAILFDASFSMNYFHAFADVLFPLYVTGMQFNRSVVILMSRVPPTLLPMFKSIFEKLTKYNIVHIDKEKQVICFSKLTVGLKAEKNLGINPLVAPHYTIRDFRAFLRGTYSLKRGIIEDCYKRRPRVLIISRRYSRRLRNGHELAKMAREMGADVSLKEMESSVSNIAQYVNSFDVMIGVHGAGLTNMVFLPDGAVLLQIVPFGVDKFSHEFFAEGCEGMNLRYLEYMTSLNESSLLGKYPPDSEIYRDPDGILLKKGLRLYHGIYLAHQDVTLDVDRFRPTLLNALKHVLP